MLKAWIFEPAGLSTPSAGGVADEHRHVDARAVRGDGADGDDVLRRGGAGEKSEENDQSSRKRGHRADSWAAEFTTGSGRRARRAGRREPMPRAPGRTRRR